jgi:NitT/TauT family transport system substrate-binding protein
LGQQQLRSLEEEAHWALGSEFVRAEQVPNYLEFFYVDALKKVKPTAVTVIQ